VCRVSGRAPRRCVGYQNVVYVECHTVCLECQNVATYVCRVAECSHLCVCVECQNVATCVATWTF